MKTNLTRPSPISPVCFRLPPLVLCFHPMPPLPGCPRCQVIHPPSPCVRDGPLTPRTFAAATAVRPPTGEVPRTGSSWTPGTPLPLFPEGRGAGGGVQCCVSAPGVGGQKISRGRVAPRLRCDGLRGREVLLTHPELIDPQSANKVI